MAKIIEQITYDGSIESRNTIMAMAEKYNVNAYISRRGIVVGVKDEQLIKKGDTVIRDNNNNIYSHQNKTK